MTRAEHAAGRAGQLSPGTVEAAGPRPKVAPLSEQRFVLQATIGQSAHDKLRYIQALLGHAVPSGDLAGTAGAVTRARRRDDHVKRRSRRLCNAIRMLTITR